MTFYLGNFYFAFPFLYCCTLFLSEEVSFLFFVGIFIFLLYFPPLILKFFASPLLLLLEYLFDWQINNIYKQRGT